MIVSLISVGRRSKVLSSAILFFLILSIRQRGSSRRIQELLILMSLPRLGFTSTVRHKQVYRHS